MQKHVQLNLKPTYYQFTKTQQIQIFFPSGNC